MILYHNPFSSCSQKVRLIFAEKNVEFESKLIDIHNGEQFDESYLLLNPNAVVPTLVHNGRAIIESSLINEYLDDIHPEPKLMPHAAYNKYIVRLFNRFIDEKLHSSAATITYGIVMRPLYKDLPAAELEEKLSQIPSEEMKANRQQVIESGVKADVFRNAFDTFIECFHIAESHLNNTRFIGGDSSTLADFSFLPYVLRFEHLGFQNHIRKFPKVYNWYEMMQARPSYEKAISNWIPDHMLEVFNNAAELAKDELASV